MMFDVKSFLQNYAIDYKERGKNIARNHVAIDCPFCTELSRSPHLNIRNNGISYICWKCRARGKNIFSLLKKLLPEEFGKLNPFEISEILSEYPYTEDENEEVLSSSSSNIRKRKFKKIWDSFLPINKNSVFYSYLRSRGITKKLDDIRCAIKGKYRNRVIFALKNAEGEIVSFVSRSIDNNAEIRYLNCSKQFSILPASCCIYGLYDILQLEKLKYLVITEGIFDAKKLIINKVPAVAILKKSISFEQRELLFDTLDRNLPIFILLDSDTTRDERKELKMSLSVYFRTVKVIHLSGAKDANMLSKLQIRILKKLLDTQVYKR